MNDFSDDECAYTAATPFRPRQGRGLDSVTQTPGGGKYSFALDFAMEDQDNCDDAHFEAPPSVSFSAASPMPHAKTMELTLDAVQTPIKTVSLVDSESSREEPRHKSSLSNNKVACAAEDSNGVWNGLEAQQQKGDSTTSKDKMLIEFMKQKYSKEAQAEMDKFLSLERNTLLKSLDYLMKENKSLRIDKETLNQENVLLKSANQDLSSRGQQHSTIWISLTNDLMRLTKERDSLRSLNEEKDVAIQKMEDNWQSTMNGWIRESQDWTLERSKEKEDMEKEFQRLQGIAVDAEKVVELHAEIAVLMNKNQELEECIALLEEQASNSDQQEILLAQVQLLQSKNSELTELVEGLQSNNSAELHNIMEQKLLLETLNHDLIESEKALKQYTEDLEMELRTLQTRHHLTVSELDALKHEQANLSEIQLSQNGEDYEQLNTRLLESEESQRLLDARCKDLESMHNSALLLVTSCETRIQELEANLGDHEKFKGKVSGLETEIARLKDEISACKKREEVLRREAEGLSAQLSVMKVSERVLGEENAALRAKLETA
ncbi:hypothetical protein HDU79_005254 [Rhizoclosmatium sp. JEL0117]|nr:hypothetical protein HDU79_005254 [Rhizoclosmatium sp. JEL0117]